MPNHITNILTITGEKEQVETCIKAIRGSEDEQYIDFNKIVPMPETLHITSGSSVDNAIDIIQNNDEKFKMMLEYPWAKEEGIKTIEELKSKIKARLSQKDFDEARMAIENEKKYGFRDWYSWSNANWGTKWNAYDQLIEDGNVIKFDTAWASPYPVMEKLAQMFPNLHFCVEYADEDLGSNCGTYEFDGGTCIGVYQPKGNEAMQHACMVKDIDFAELVLDNFDNWSMKSIVEIEDKIVEMLLDDFLSDLVDNLDTSTPEGIEKVKYLETLCVDNELYEEAEMLKNLVPQT